MQGRKGWARYDAVLPTNISIPFQTMIVWPESKQKQPQDRKQFLRHHRFLSQRSCRLSRDKRQLSLGARQGFSEKSNIGVVWGLKRRLRELLTVRTIVKPVAHDPKTQQKEQKYQQESSRQQRRCEPAKEEMLALNWRIFCFRGWESPQGLYSLEDKRASAKCFCLL